MLAFPAAGERQEKRPKTERWGVSSRGEEQGRKQTENLLAAKMMVVAIGPSRIELG